MKPGFYQPSTKHQLFSDRKPGFCKYLGDRFPGAFPFPLILWVTDEVHKKLIRLAPDLENIATSGISFVPGP